MAVLYGDLGRFPEAYELLKRILEIQGQVLGVDNPDVATTVANLAAICFRSKRIEESEALYRRALPIFERSRADDPNLVIFLSPYRQKAGSEEVGGARACDFRRAS